MQLSQSFIRRLVVIAAVGVAVLVIGIALALEPVTRKWVANADLCTYCHLEREYVPTVRMSWSRRHPLDAEKAAARCVDCHVPEGLAGSIKAYLHFASLTDFFGRLRDRETERAGDWTPPRAVTAYRVRDGLLENDSVTCRSCHVESEIKPKRKRGQNAHKLALEQKQTCIECHYNLVHRKVDRRKNALKKPEPRKK